MVVRLAVDRQVVVPLCSCSSQVVVRLVEVQWYFWVVLHVQEQRPLVVVVVPVWLVVQVGVDEAEVGWEEDPRVHLQVFLLLLCRFSHLLAHLLPSNLHQLSVQQLLLDACETPPAASARQLPSLPFSPSRRLSTSPTYLPTSSIQVGASLRIHGEAMQASIAARNGTRTRRFDSNPST